LWSAAVKKLPQLHLLVPVQQQLLVQVLLLFLFLQLLQELSTTSYAQSFHKLVMQIMWVAFTSTATAAAAAAVNRQLQQQQEQFEITTTTI